MNPVKMFVFAGRKANLEIQLPYVRRILDENENVSFDVWNLTRNDEDDEFVRAISGERISVMNNFAGMEPHLGWNRVYDYYTSMKFRDHLMVKADDDVVFIHTDRFKDFISAARNNPDKVISAQVINNGACTELEPALQAGFEALNIPLLDVHEYASYGSMCHDWFFHNWQDLISAETKLVPCNSWCSINLICYSYNMGRQISAQLGRRSPKHIAGRDFGPRQKLGDEGMVNMLPIKILKGFYAGHLTFGPQKFTDEAITRHRSQYAEIAKHYLGESCG